MRIIRRAQWFFMSLPIVVVVDGSWFSWMMRLGCEGKPVRGVTVEGGAWL